MPRMTAFDVGEDCLLDVRERMDDPDKKPTWGWSYGLDDMDQLTGGIHPHQLEVIMARPGVGKSVLLGQILRIVADQYSTDPKLSDLLVRLVAQEMHPREYQQRLHVMLSGIPSNRIEAGLLDEDEFLRYQDAVRYVQSLPIEYLYQTTGVDETEEFLRDTAHGKKTGYFAVDYVQIHPWHPKYRIKDPTELVSELANFFMKMAQQVAPGMLVSQMSRESDKREDKRPQLADLRQSGQLEQNAHKVWGIYRPDMYEDGPEGLEQAPKDAELLLLKQRGGQGKGVVHLTFYPAEVRFGPRARRSGRSKVPLHRKGD